MNEDLVYTKWLAAGAPGGKPASRRYAGRVLAGTTTVTRHALDDRTAREDFAQLRRGIGERRVHDDGTFGEPYPLELVLIDNAEAHRFRQWVARSCPGGGLRTQAAGRRTRDRASNQPPTAETAARLRDAWLQLRGFIRTDGTFDETKFKTYRGKGLAIPGTSDGQRSSKR